MRYCIVNHEKKYAYVNVAKAACTSIKLAIAQDMHVSFEKLQWNQPWRRTLGYATSLPKEFYVFTFMRHPADRLVSCWADWCCEPFPAEGNFRANLDMRPLVGSTFEKFVNHVCKLGPYAGNHHYAPQEEAITYMGNVIPQIYHFENLTKDWKILQAMFDLPKLPHDRKSQHKPWREYYTPELLTMVQEHYSGDYRLGGYKLTM